MICDVCGTGMRREPHEPNPWYDDAWICPWCFAFAHVGGDCEIARLVYMPPDMRWERAVIGDQQSEHAYGVFRTTLCGIERGDISPSEHLWYQRESDCGACGEAAEVIDARWPPGMRGLDARVSVQRPSSQ